MAQGYHESTMQTDEVVCYRYWSERRRYLSISSPTQLTTANSYMIFTLRSNFQIEDVTPLPHNGCRARKRRRV